MFKHLLIAVVLLASSAAHAALNIQHWTLANGARVYFVENHTIPMLDVSVEFDAGSKRDPAEKSGVASLANTMLARGLKAATLADGSVEPAMTESQLSDAIADIAAQRGGGPGTDRAGIVAVLAEAAAPRSCRAPRIVASGPGPAAHAGWTCDGTDRALVGAGRSGTTFNSSSTGAPAPEDAAATYDRL